MEENFSTQLSDKGSAEKHRIGLLTSSDAINPLSPTQKALRDKLAGMKAELDTLLERAATLPDQELSDSYQSILKKYGEPGQAVGKLAAQAKNQFATTVDSGMSYVKDNPLQTIGIAAGAGALLGLLFRRE